MGHGRRHTLGQRCLHHELSGIGRKLAADAASSAADVSDSIIEPAANVFLSLWLLLASRAFRRVATSDVADGAHMLAGLKRLRFYFMGQMLLLFAGVLLSMLLGD